ncbi:MAG: glycosyltransferase [Pseudomonadota bacterium]
MILVEAGGDDAEAFESKLVFAAALADAGYRPVIDDRTIPAGIPGFLRYEAAPFLADVAHLAPARLVMIGTERIEASRLAVLRGMAARIPQAAAVGRFARLQDRLAATALLAHALGREPAVADLCGLQPSPWPCASAAPLMARIRPASVRGGPVRLLLWLPPAMADDPAERGALLALSHRPDIALRVVVPADAVPQADLLSGLGLACYRASELSPGTFGRWPDLFACAGGDPLPLRGAAIGVTAVANGAVPLDLTPGVDLARAGVPALRGMPALAALGPYLASTVLPNLDRIRQRVRDSLWLANLDLQRLERALCLDPGPLGPGLRKSRPPEVHFLPTNGIGLGHARRALRLAGALPARLPVRFFAYGSCSDLLSSSGRPVLDLLSRSTEHGPDNPSEVVNYLRLRRHLIPGDLLVFDGGFVYDSVMRSLAETGARGIWVRRGLWQPRQANLYHLSREKNFDRVIVPGEAFPEINRPLSWGDHVSTVGPIIGPSSLGSDDRQGLRDKIARTKGRDFERLVVTMLGAGVAADRSVQKLFLCQMFERREDVLHLMLAWPGSAIDPRLYGWRASRVVETSRAAELAAAADFVVSAAGYNSFHELIYNGVPAIFVPQMAPYMDDQAARAEAAARRGLALCVAAENLLDLARSVQDLLAGRGDALRLALAAADLPDPGTAQAARIIAEMADA